MFNRDKKDESFRRETKQSINLTPALGTPAPPARGSSEQTHGEVSLSNAAKSGSKALDGKGSKLIVGPDIKLKGAEITDCDTLVVEGRVEAAMDSRVIHIAEHGVFSGTVGLDIAEINGRFEGELTARQQLVVHTGGKVSGKIRYGKLTVEEGGEISGDVSSLATDGNASSGKSGDALHATPDSPDIMTAYDPFARKTTTPSKSSGPTLAS